jgi:hypothetical protein
MRRESDPLIVLGDGRADHRGKGRTEVRNRQRKHWPASGRATNANLTAGNSDAGLSEGRSRKRVLLRSPVLEYGTPGSVGGRSGKLAVLPR